MKYVALLRGINVGGNNPVKMSELKMAFEKYGHKNVLTYINSGNVIFESVEESSEKLTKELESLLTKTFKYDARVVVRSQEQMKKTVKSVPSGWNTRTDIRCYVGFLARPATKEEIAGVTVREGVDSLKVENDALYMTSLVSKLTKSAFNKLPSSALYKEMTIRNYNTTKKILALMEEE